MERTTPDFAAILKRLIDAEADFVIVGGYAVMVHGCDNSTTDIDFAISRDRLNTQRIADALAPIHPRPEEWPDGLPYIWDAETVRRATILTLLTDEGSLDLLAEAPGMEGFRELKVDSSTISIYGFEVPVASIDDLIKMKRAANRPKDQVHVMQLLALKKLLSGEQ